MAPPSDPAGTSNSTLAGSQTPTGAQSRETLTPLAYAQTVELFSKLASGTGANHQRLARFLSPLLPRGLPSHSGAWAPAVPFVTIYEFCLAPDDTPVTPRNDTLNLHPPSKGPSGAALKPKWKLKDAAHYTKCAEYARHKIPSKDESPGQILFMRGHPTAEWVAHVGSAHRVDPEFFSRWLNFPHGDDQPNNHSLPSLPSSGWNILELPLVSIGGHASAKDFRTQRDLDDARRQSANAVRAYHNNLYTSNEAPGCTSVARDVCLFDEDNFAVEQKITICMQPSQDATKDSVSEPKGWVLLIWIDASDDLGSQILKSAWGPSSGKLQHNDYTLWPIVRYRPNMGLNAHALHEEEVSSSSAALPSASQFHLSFGRSLQRNAMAADPFYALYEVFGICSASQKQFLNLVEHKLTHYTKHNDGDFDALPNLRYIKQILSRQMKQIQEVRHTIGNTKQSKWPRLKSDVTMRAEKAVEQDYSHLFDYAKTLDGRCQEAIEILMNSVAILDSKKAMLQSERVAKLTFLAFIFVPLSFTTSFFGMNFNELGNQSIWEWFTLTVPIMAFTLIVFFVDILGRWNGLVNSIKKRVR